MIDPLTVDEDALAQRGMTLAARRRGDVTMMARNCLFGVAPMAVMQAHGGDRGRDGLVVVAPTGLRSRSDIGVTVTAPMLHGRGGDWGRLSMMVVVAVMDRRDGDWGRAGMMAVVTVMDRCGGRRLRGVMVVTMMGGRRIRAARTNGGGEGQGGGDGHVERRSHNLS